MKKYLLSIISFITILLFSTTNVYAIKIADAGDIVNQVGNYESSRFVAGNKITSKATIDGISFIAGNEINLEGSTSYGFYAGNNITINEKIEKDAFIAGNIINIESDSILGRDLYVAGSSVKIKANVARDLRVGGETVDISGITIGGNAYIGAEELILDENTVITGKLTYDKESKVVGLDKAKVGSVNALKTESNKVNYSFKDLLVDFLISVLSSFAVLVVLFYLIPSSKERLNNIELSFNSIIKYLGIGFLVLIAVPIISIIMLFTGILIPLALITIALYIVSIYISTLLIYYVVGNLITSKLFKVENTYLALICGIILVKLIKLIPYIGGWISALALFFGLGLIFIFIKNNNKKSN